MSPRGLLTWRNVGFIDDFARARASGVLGLAEFAKDQSQHDTGYQDTDNVCRCFHRLEFSITETHGPSRRPKPLARPTAKIARVVVR